LFCPKAVFHQPGEELRKQLNEEWECPDFTPWVLGFTPEEDREMLDRQSEMLDRQSSSNGRLGVRMRIVGGVLVKLKRTALGRKSKHKAKGSGGSFR
jgi:hypothetical protein